MRVSSACCSHRLHLELSLCRLMVSVLDSGSMGPGSSPGRGHCVVFLGKTLYSHSASLHLGIQMATSKCAGGNPATTLPSANSSNAVSHRFHCKQGVFWSP